MISVIKKHIKEQQGFTLIELLVVIAILGVMASIAVPKYVDSTAIANGGKVLADLQSIDSAIQQYAAANGVEPAAITEPGVLKDYFASGKFPEPPTAMGKLTKIKNTEIKDKEYAISSGRATIDGKTAEDLSK
ncbi:hypothetical protein P22_0147 [Propionispora sp. 2/2-37]|uniref:type II secretion system protein n=1 Tax=Propionispora sp. 2/2-37 TaxID=1677858 RepID=UPI0006BB8BED|nr:type II secretion system protein [Propionispora sp. 2/2-37]CUH94085.1 hypothetical protein P22_0147 [Propionispora sp. 2/2-37]